MRHNRVFCLMQSSIARAIPIGPSVGIRTAAGIAVLGTGRVQTKGMFAGSRLVYRIDAGAFAVRPRRIIAVAFFAPNLPLQRTRAIFVNVIYLGPCLAHFPVGRAGGVFPARV